MKLHSQSFLYEHVWTVLRVQSIICADTFS
jgi:hypothetical protein